MGLKKLGGGGGGIPSGGVIMWTGSPNNIPDGWTLCDGSNGAPDLQNQFVVGAGDEYSSGDTGGEKEVQLTEDEMPSHTHQYTDRYNQTSNNGDGGMVGFNMTNQTRTTKSAGGDQSHENRPPYYALAYIMKL
jgi:microcystin-dependent protein